MSKKLRLASGSSILLRLFCGALLLHTFVYAVTEEADTHTSTYTAHGHTSMGLLGSTSQTQTQPARKGHVPLDVDGYPVAPPELELEQVHIYVRHGTSSLCLACSSLLLPSSFGVWTLGDGILTCRIMLLPT